MKKKAFLFTTDVCPRCPVAKRSIEERKLGERLDIIEVNAMEKMDLAQKYSIHAAPTLVVVDQNDDEISRYNYQQILELNPEEL